MAGSISEKDRICLECPGPNNPWSCPRCDQVEVTVNDLVKHMKNKHQVKVVTFRCSCGFTITNNRSVGTHRRYCNGEVPEEHQRKHKCDKCLFTSDAVNGLHVHLLRKHPEIRNEQLKTKKKNFAWSDPELEFLAETIIRLKKEGVRKVNEVAAELLPGRTAVGIQAIRTKSDNKRAEKKVKEREWSKSSPNLRTKDSEQNLIEGASADNDLQQLLLNDLDQDLEIVIEPTEETFLIGLTLELDESDNVATDHLHRSNSVRTEISRTRIEINMQQACGTEISDSQYQADAIKAISEFTAVNTCANELEYAVEQYLIGETPWKDVVKKLQGKVH